jgi:hypothetical protein
MPCTRFVCTCLAQVSCHHQDASCSRPPPCALLLQEVFEFGMLWFCFLACPFGASFVRLVVVYYRIPQISRLNLAYALRRQRCLVGRLDRRRLSRRQARHGRQGGHLPRDVEEKVQVRRPYARRPGGSSPVAEGGTPAQARAHRSDCGPMAWLPWKGKKKILETTEKSREMQDSSTLKKAAPAKEPETAPSKPDAAEESTVDCCAICLTGLEPTERAFVFEGCRCRSCVCAACRFANDAHARTH